MTSPFGLAALAIVAAALAGCAASSSPPPAGRPSFYEDLASPTARVDAQKAAQMISEYRARAGVGPLRVDPELSRIAATYARQMAAADKLSHSLAPYGNLNKRLNDAGYRGQAAGENIASGYRTLAEAFSGWRDSPPHDRGMKDPEMTVMGIGTAYNPNSKYKVYWSVIFARPYEPGTLAAAGPGVAPGQ